VVVRVQSAEVMVAGSWYGVMVAHAGVADEATVTAAVTDWLGKVEGLQAPFTIFLSTWVVLAEMQADTVTADAVVRWGWFCR
jgi:hypothetical protein